MNFASEHVSVSGAKYQSLVIFYLHHWFVVILCKGTVVTWRFTDNVAVYFFVQRKLTGTQPYEQNEINSRRSDKISFDSCLLLNISQCEVAEQNKKFVVTVYNPLSQPVTHVIRIPAHDNTTFKVYNSEGKQKFHATIVMLSQK